jgi:ribosomal protein S18 acetylase RimI-like enzyme
MVEFIIREATTKDVPFLVETIIEAEKSGTDKLSYSTIFGLSEGEAREYIADMLLEEVDGCELSISSFIIIEKNGQIAAAAAAWIEGINGIPSTVLKGNLLNYTLPKEYIVRALSINHILRDLHIEYISETIQLGLVYVSTDFRGLNLVSLLIDEQVLRLRKVKPNITAMYVQVFGNNFPAIKAYERANFKAVMTKESSSEEIIQYLPSNKKTLMKKELITK